MSRHAHVFHALWVHFGEHGPQDVHYHPCLHEGRTAGSRTNGSDCDRVLLGLGRECDGSNAYHERATLGDDGSVESAVRKLRGAGTPTEDEERYGFRWGPLVVQRVASVDRGRGDYRILELKTDAGRKLTVYVSPRGRSLRVWRDGKELA